LSSSDPGGGSRGRRFGGASAFPGVRISSTSDPQHRIHSPDSSCSITSCAITFWSTISPGPFFVFTFAPMFGSSFFSSMYTSFSYRRQHFSFPHRPLIFSGSSVVRCVFAIFIVIGSKSLMNVWQQSCCPHVL